jgi:hypothetical protein
MTAVLPSAATASCFDDILPASTASFQTQLPIKNVRWRRLRADQYSTGMAICLMIGDLQGVW